eukprot:221561_1
MSTEDDKVIYEHVANDTELTEQPKIESLLNDKEYSNTHSMSVNDDQNDLPYQKPTLSNNDTFVIKTVDNIDNAESKEEIPILSPITCSSPSNGLDKYNSNEEIQMFSPTITGYNSAEYGSNHDMKYDPIKVIDIDEEDLPLPYKKGCFHKTKFRFKTFLIIHPRIYALYLLFIQTWPRILLVFDMYTDLVVAYELYQGEQRVWFMLSSLFFVLPFILVWFASLRFIQLYVQKLYDKLDVHSDKSTNNIIKSKNNIYSKLKKKSSLIHTVINIFLMIYMFPLIGSLFMAVAEVMWIISDVFHGFKAFVFGTGLIETENRQIKAMKSYRRTVEVFSESVPQSLLQFYIFIRLSIMEQTTENASYQGVSQNALYLSFGVSMVNLGYNFYRFKKEAQLHGMSWSEYSLSVLQLAEVPVIKLVPRTPAIKKGLITEANFAGFKFDKQSITPLLDAISDENSKLTTIKLSVASLSQLDAHSCKYLGNLLHHTGIKVLISRCSSLLDLKNLFQEFDIDHKGYITELEFFNALKTLNCSIQHDQKKKTFKKLAVRRLPQRDRIYWYDFFKITASVKKRNALKVAFDLTEIEYPMHFIFQEIQKLIKSNQPEKIELMNHFENLFQFNVGLGTLNKIDISSNNHVFYSIVDVHALLYETRKPYPYYARFVAKTFDKLLTSHIFDAKFYLRRNKIFLADDDDVKQKSSNSVRWVTKLQNDNKPGINIFEHCLLYSQCKLFARFLDVWLNKSDTRDIEDSINENGELYHLFYETNGFHLTDISEYTPLYYAVQHKLENVIEFYGKYVFKNEILLSKTDCKWLNDQKYLHKIVHDSLKTNSNVDLFKILLSSHIDLSEWFEDRPIAHNMIVYRSIYPNHKDYILECFEALKDFSYDFKDLTDFKGSNILHYAAKWKDIDAAQLIVNLDVSDKDEYLNKLLNQENELNMTPLKIAIWDPESDCAELAKLLMLNEHQKNIDYKIFASKLECAATQEQWIQCLYEMIIETDCYILNKISKDDKQDIFIKIYQIHEEELTENSKNNLYKNIKKITQQIRSIHRELKKHLDTTDIDIAACVKLNINDKPKRSFDKPRHSSSLARSLTNFGKKKHRSRSANSAELNEKQIQSDQNPLYIKDLYLKAISNHDNSCFGINHISPKDAAYVWLGIDLLFNMIKCFICISLGFWYDYRQRFELGLYPNVENYLYKAFSGCWIVICITNLLAIYGISKFSKTLLLLKLITFIIDIELTIFCAVMYLFLKQQTLTTSFMIICITFVSLNMLFTLFGFYDVYKIYKLIKRYSNGDYEDSMYGLDTDYISEHVYKIVNVNDPYLNGKHCEILLKLDEENYRVKLVNDTYSVGPSLRVIHKSNLKIEQDTQNKLFQNKTYNENAEHKTESDVLQSLDMNKLPMQKRSQYRANRICADFNTDKIWMGEVNVDNGRKGGKFGGKKRRSLNNVTINKNNIKRSERPKDIDKKNSNSETKAA